MGVGVKLQLVDGALQNVSVDASDHSEAFDHRHELASDNDLAVRLNDSEQAFVQFYLARHAVNDGLIGKAQAIFP